jgi:UDP-glucose 4-epimerase
MKVLVIGSGGYMGRHLMRALAKEGIETVGASTANGSGINPTTGLLPDNFLVAADTTAVVYMAQSPRYRQVPEQASHVLAVNTLSAIRAAIAARTAGVTRFIYLSTGTVYAPCFEPLVEGAPVRRDSWYVLSKLHGEEALSLFRQDMEVIVVRPFGVYGPEQQGRLVSNLIHSVRNHKPITLQSRLGDSENRDGLKISLCYIDDATGILLSLVQNGGPACLNLAGIEALSIRSMAESIGCLIDRSPEFVPGIAPRDSDLIADTRLLCSSVPISFTSFAVGLERSMATIS